MKLTVNIIDAFTQERFKGNPAAVVITEQWIAEDLMQSIATENNLSETAFLIPSGENRWEIRWFSPLTEVDFCGHATLASSYVLFTSSTSSKQITLFAEAVGEMTISHLDDGKIQMNFPNRLPELVEKVPAELIKGLSKKPVKVLRNSQAYFAIYDNEYDITELTTDNEQLKQLAPYGTGVSSAGREYDFVSRYFSLLVGGEDPVTGSIHTALSPYWAKQLNKDELVAYQASHRTGTLYCKVDGERVLISGFATPYLQGTIEV